MLRRDLAEMRGLHRTRRALAFVRNTTPRFTDARPFRFTVCLDFCSGLTRNRWRNVSANARGRLPCRLVSRTRRLADIQPQQAEYRDIAKPRKEVMRRKFRWRNSTTVRHAVSSSVPREFENNGHRVGNDPPMLRQNLHTINAERTSRMMDRPPVCNRKTAKKTL